MNKVDLYLNYWEVERARLYDIKERSRSVSKQLEYDAVCLFVAHLKEIKNDI